MPFPRLAAVAVLTAVLAACSSVPYTQLMQQRQAAYVDAAGAPVRSFHFVFGASIYSWEPLSDSQLVIYTVPDRAYLLDTWPCNNLPFASAVGFTSFAGEVSTGFDKVLTGRDYIPCPIKQIRPVDLTRFKLEQAAQRHIDVMARDGTGGTSPTGGN